SRSGREVTELIHDLHQQGHTIILITHNNAQAEEADRKVRIQDGFIVSDEKVIR
ncbi:MAG TPA: macrolide ABC transporter ATP-binding protein, partial [Peptococcaceae bacterium]|nr:macrolide ABC transporter ATP-binding protein [Peptococcaceae bacterium]